MSSGVAVSRFREEKAIAPDSETFNISAKVQRSKEGVSGNPAKAKAREERPGWGALGRQDRTFNKGTRHSLLECGAVMDMWHGRNAIVLTGTLPGSTNESNEVLARYSAYIVNRLNQHCRRAVAGELWCFYVWEWQKRGALHIHYCVASNSRDSLSRLCAGFRDFWFGLLLQLSEESGVDIFRRATGGSWRHQKNKLQADAQFVQKSVAAYFAKYAGKNYHSEVSHHLKSRKLTRFVPSRWAGWSRPISRAMKQCRWNFEVEGDRRSIEKRMNEISGFLASFAVKKNSWDWHVIPGSTDAYYFRTETLLEVQSFFSDLLSSRYDDGKNGMKKEIELIAASAGRRLAFSKWLKDKKETKNMAIWSSLFNTYLEGRCTEKGEGELESLAIEFRGRQRFR